MTVGWPGPLNLLQRLGLEGNVFLALGALLPVFLNPGFVALAGGGGASGEGQGGDFGIGNGGALVAAGEHETNYGVLQRWADAAIEKISGDLAAIFAGDGHVAAIVECFFDDCANVGFRGELGNPSLKVFSFEAGNNFEFIISVRLSENLRGVGQRGIVPVFSTAHTRLSSCCACGEGASICASI